MTFQIILFLSDMELFMHWVLQSLPFIKWHPYRMLQTSQNLPRFYRMLQVSQNLLHPYRMLQAS